MLPLKTISLLQPSTAFGLDSTHWKLPSTSNCANQVKVSMKPSPAGILANHPTLAMRQLVPTFGTINTGEVWPMSAEAWDGMITHAHTQLESNL